MASKKKRRSILIASCVLAALIVGGSTFAWFTSKDEVVNKISATSNYNVVAVEDFTPPNNWTPGQTVDKDVRVTNTGNVDAFVRASISGDLVLTRMTDSKNVSQDTLKNAIELSTTSTAQDNPDTPATSADQVRAKQAGSRLVYSADTTGYNATALQSDAGVTLSTDDNGTFVTVDKDDTANDFKPTAEGYYIFARSTTENKDTAGFVSKIVYDGYYYVPGTAGAEGKYYDIEVTPTSNDPYKITAKLRQKETVLITDDNLTYTVSGDKKTLTVKYVGTQNEDSETADDIIIDIALDNITYWTAADDGKTYYYNAILKAGQTTEDLITSVTLNKDVTKDAFLAMDYNLKVTIDSVQVSDDNDKTTAVKEEWTDKVPTLSTTNDTVSWATPQP